MDNFQKTRIRGKCFQSITKHGFAESPFQGASVYLLTKERTLDVDFCKSDKISFPAFAPRFPGQQLTGYMQELYLIKEIKQKECVIIHRWTIWYSPIKNFEKTRKKDVLLMFLGKIGYLNPWHVLFPLVEKQAISSDQVKIQVFKDLVKLCIYLRKSEFVSLNYCFVI